MAPVRAAYVWLIVCLIWVLLILVLSLVPQPPELPLPLLSWDKFQHASAYTLLTLLAGRSWSALRPGWPRGWWWAAGSALVFGICLELTQWLMKNGRTGDLRDVLANATGIFFALLLVMIWRWFR